MRRGLSVGIAAWVVALSSVVSHPSASSSPQAQPVASTAAASDSALVTQYCVTCHIQRLKTGGLTLDTMSFSNIPAGAEVWEKVIRKVRAGMMPPPGMPRPEQTALDGFVSHLETAIDQATL